MAPKKQSKKKVLFEEGCSPEKSKQLVPEDKVLATYEEPEAGQAMQLEPRQESDSLQATVTSTESTKKRYGAPRGPSAMYKVVIKKAQGKKIKVRTNHLGVPIGKSRHVLQSYVGMVARNTIPIDIRSWPNVNSDLKKKLWNDIENTFKISPKSEAYILHSAGTKWRQFKSTLTTKHVMPFKGDKKKLRKPPRKYEFVGKDIWKKFVGQRIGDDWMTIRESQSGRVKERKYPHRTSRKGYIGLIEEEVKSGKIEPGDVPDRAILWKKARMRKDQTVDPEVAAVVERIDTFLELKRTGEFQPSGSDDVLTRALQTPEHSGRVRAVGGFVTPTMFFNLPTPKRTRITKSDLLARDRQRDEEMERTKRELAELKAMISGLPSTSSPFFSDKASCLAGKDSPHSVLKAPGVEPTIVRLIVDDDVEGVPIDPTPPEKKGPRSCELSVDNITNKVAFGTIFDEPEMNSVVHGVPLKPGCIRVSVDGAIQPDALIPVPIIEGEIEKVKQAIGSMVAWPQDLITIAPLVKIRKEGLSSKKKEKSELRRIAALFNEMEPTKNVPKGFKLLYKHATSTMKECGLSIPIKCDAEVFGFEKTIYILHENLIALLNFEEIGQSAISAHMSYLYTLVRDNNDLDLFGFFDPGVTFTLNKEFESYVVKRLLEGSYDRMFLMPHNQNYHWILVVIWAGEIFILNPLSHPHHFPELERALSSALKSVNAQTGRGSNMPKVKNLAGSPKQPGGHECGYVVMRYMKDIICDKEMTFTTKWASKNRKSSYTREELDKVRIETLTYIQDRM